MTARRTIRRKRPSRVKNRLKAGTKQIAHQNIITPPDFPALRQILEDAAKRRNAIEAEDARTGKTRDRDRIIISSFVASLRCGNKNEITELSELLLDYATKGSLSPPGLRYLVAELLPAMGRTGAPFSPAFTEMLVKEFVGTAIPRHQRKKPDARRRAIEFIVANPNASKNKIAKHAGVDRRLVQRWIKDAGFRREVDQLSRRVHGDDWLPLAEAVERRHPLRQVE